MNKSFVALSAVLLGLTGCGQKPAEETTTAPATAAPVASAPPAETGVIRAETAPPAEPAAPAKPALDTQPGPEGTQVALTKALVRGDILTVELQYSIPRDADRTPTIFPKIEQINYVDDATSKKYGVLKDQEGTFMATPVLGNTKQLHIRTTKNGPAIATFKFPAPPATSQTISLVVPEVGSFDGVAVQR